MRFPRLWRRLGPRQVQPSDADVLVEDAEAYLRGAMARRFDERSAQAPPWAWVNALAHASPDSLLFLAAARPGPWRVAANREWAEALAGLARELLAVALEDPVSLGDIQSHRLAPVELRWARPGAAVPGRPDQMAAALRALWRPAGPAPAGPGPAPAIGRNLGQGRLNRLAFRFLGPASVRSEGYRPPLAPPPPPEPPVPGL